MQSLARSVKSRFTPTLRHFVSSSSSSGGPSCGLRTLSHAHGHGPSPNAEPSSFSGPLDGQYLRQLPYSHYSSQSQMMQLLLPRFFCSKPSSNGGHAASSSTEAAEGQGTTAAPPHASSSVSLKQGEVGGSREYLQELTQQRRWGFIRKVYGIVGTQLLTTAAVSSAVVVSPGLSHFLLTSPKLLMALFFGGLLSLWPLHVYKNEYPKNMITLGAFTLMQSLLIATCCALTDGKVVLEALATTTAAVTSLTAYTFWAAHRGKDFTFLGPILFPCLTAMATISLINIFLYPVPALDSIAYNTFGALVFSSYLVLDTDSLIKRYKYDEYIPASINLYLDILNLFLQLLKILSKMKKN